MKVKKTSNFWNNIARDWYIYLFAFGIVIAIALYTVRIVNLPKNEQTITLFIGEHSNDSSKLHELLNKNKPDYIKEKLIYCYSIEDSNYDSYYTYYGINGADLVIIPQSKINDNSIMSHYAKLDKEYIENYLPSSKYYEIGETNNSYGILVHKEGSISSNDLIKYYSSDDQNENYFAFFNKNSKHIGKLNNTNYVTAFNFLKLIIDYEK